MAWSVAERVRAVQLYYRERSVVGAQRALQAELGYRRFPNSHTLKAWIRLFESTGSVVKARYPRPGRRVPQSLIAKVERAIRRNPRLSVRQLCSRTSASRGTVHSVLRRCLKLYPFKLQLVQRLRRGDKAKRLRFCRWALGARRARSLQRWLFISDEATFGLEGTVQKQNCRIWGEENPHAVVERDTQMRAHVTVWCAISSSAIVGPYFFEEGRRAVTVTGARYSAMLESFFLPELHRRHVDVSKAWFQQDGATPHTTRGVLQYLQGVFPNRVLSKGTAVPWPPRSPDLSPADFYLWGHVKAQVYQSPVRSVRELKLRIRRAVAAIPADVLNSVMANFILRCRRCRCLRGCHLENVLIHH